MVTVSISSVHERRGRKAEKEATIDLGTTTNGRKAKYLLLGVKVYAQNQLLLAHPSHLYISSEFSARNHTASTSELACIIPLNVYDMFRQRRVQKFACVKTRSLS